MNTFQVVEPIQELPVLLGIHLPLGVLHFQLEKDAIMAQKGPRMQTWIYAGNPSVLQSLSRPVPISEAAAQELYFDHSLSGDVTGTTSPCYSPLCVSLFDEVCIKSLIGCQFTPTQPSPSSLCKPAVTL